MTYCLGILLRDGLVLASDARSNAGVDQVVRVSKLALMPPAPQLIGRESFALLMRHDLGNARQERDHLRMDPARQDDLRVHLIMRS